MQIKKTKFKGLKIVRNKIYRDSRGCFKEDFKSAFFKGAKFIFSCTSKSKKTYFCVSLHEPYTKRHENMTEHDRT